MADNMAYNLLSDIQVLTYREESRNGNFDKYEAMHVALHKKVRGLVAFGFTMIDKASLLIRLRTVLLTLPYMW